MLRRFLTASALVAASLSFTSAPASADAPGRSLCVTKAEERRLPGMTPAEVRNLLGWDGYANDLADGARDYRPCGRSWEKGRVIVRFGKAGRVWYPVRLLIEAGTLDLPSEHPKASRA